MNVEYVTIYPDGYETSETVTAGQALSSAIKHDGDCVFELDSPGEYSGIPASVMMHVRDVQISRITDGRHQIALSLPVTAYYTLRKVIRHERGMALPFTGLYHDRERNIVWYDKAGNRYAITVPAGDEFDFAHTETRWRLVDETTSRIIDDAQGYGYRSAQAAHRAHGHKTAAHGRRPSDVARRHGGARTDHCEPNWRTCRCGC